MEKRIILAIFLMLIVAVLPSILFPPKKPADGRSGGQARGGTAARNAARGPRRGEHARNGPRWRARRAAAARRAPCPPARRLCRNRVGHVPDLPPGLQHAGRGARERGAVGIPLVHPRGLWGGP